MSTITLTFSDNKTRSYKGENYSYALESGCIFILDSGKVVDTYSISQIDKIS